MLVVGDDSHACLGFEIFSYLAPQMNLKLLGGAESGQHNSRDIPQS